MLLFSVLAGCLGSTDDLEDEAITELREGTGILEGRVLDGDLFPLGNATVSVVHGGLVAEETTAPDGNYRIVNLDPQVYRIQVSAPCCREEVKQVEVVADNVTTMNLMLQRFSDGDLRIPIVEELEWEGFYGCGTATVILLVSSGCGDPNHDRYHPFEIGRGLKTLLMTMEWEDGANAADSYRVYIDRVIQGSSNHRYMTLQGGSPLEGRLDTQEIEADFDGLEEDDHWTIGFSVWAGSSVNVIYQQPFTIYYELHYWEPAPEEARAGPE